MGRASDAANIAASRGGFSRRGGARPSRIDELVSAIRAVLSDSAFVEAHDLLKPEYRARANPRPLFGHCYVASEAYYHLAGGKAAGLKACGLKHEGAQHWWLRDRDGTDIDLTGEQFRTPVPYQNGKGRGFLTREPSRRARVVIERVLAEHPRLRRAGFNQPTP